MKIVIPGGTGQVGKVLRRGLEAAGHEVILLSRSGQETGSVLYWDGRTLGDWARALDGADAVINLAGRSVNCRYTAENMKAMMDSRVDSTRVVGEAIAQAENPPRTWLQMSTATIYAHTFGPAHDEATGVIGGQEPGVPDYWGYSVEIGQAWERTQAEAETPQTRKIALRTAMVMSPDSEGIFDVLRGLTRWGLGGSIAGGKQYVSWIHEHDLVRAVLFLLEQEEHEGVFNLASPGPLSQREFQALLRQATGAWIGLPATRWMATIGAVFMRTDTELILKSRRVVPGRLLEAGFGFDYPDWEGALAELVAR